MKAVILCAGNGERLKPLTESTPKPLILINEKPILYFILNEIPSEIDEVFIVIQKEKIDYFENFLNNFKFNFKITIIFQDLSKKGTYYALFSAKEFLLNEDKFLVLNGDDIFLKDDLEKIIKMPDPCYGLSLKSLDKRYRTCDLDIENRKIVNFRRQKEEEHGKELPCFAGVLLLNKDFFNYIPIVDNNEAGLPHTLFGNCNNVFYFNLGIWIQINNFEDIKNAEMFLKQQPLQHP